jgi:Bacterial SH3 domain
VKRILIALALIFSLLTAIPAHAQDATPPLGLYIVLPMSVPNVYIPHTGRFQHLFYPATFFAVQLNLTSGTTSFEDIALNSAWLNAIRNMNGAKADDYLCALPDGIFFGDHPCQRLRTVVFPGNEVNCIQWKYRKGEWWCQIQTLPYTLVPPVLNPTTTSSYLLQKQTDENSDGIVRTSPDLMGFEVYVPLVSIQPVWVPLSQLIQAPQSGRKYEVTNTGGWLLNLRSGASTSFASIEKLPEYSTVTEIGLSADGQWMNVTAPDGQNGWCSVVYLEAE